MKTFAEKVFEMLLFACFIHQASVESDGKEHGDFMEGMWRIFLIYTVLFFWSGHPPFLEVISHNFLAEDEIEGGDVCMFGCVRFLVIIYETKNNTKIWVLKLLVIQCSYVCKLICGGLVANEDAINDIPCISHVLGLWHVPVCWCFLPMFVDSEPNFRW